jgi:inorganic triphosphatase YgiF
MGIEFELKFRANCQQQAAIRQAFTGEEAIYQMQTTYYDTPTGSFSAISERRLRILGVMTPHRH